MIAVNSLVVHLVLRLLRHRISSGIARAPDVPFQSESEESNDPEAKRAGVSNEVERLVRGTVDLTGDADFVISSIASESVDTVEDPGTETEPTLTCHPYCQMSAACRRWWNLLRNPAMFWPSHVM